MKLLVDVPVPAELAEIVLKDREGRQLHGTRGELTNALKQPWEDSAPHRVLEPGQQMRLQVIVVP